jgi:hypothetical protein
MVKHPDPSRAVREKDPQKLRQYLRDPHESVRAAAILNPRTPHDAVRTLLAGSPGKDVVAALVLHPAITSDERAQLLRGADMMMHSTLIARLAEIASTSKSSAELAELAKHPHEAVLDHVAWNRHTSRETRAYLRHWSSSARVAARMPRLFPTSGSPADPTRLQIIAEIVEHDRAENRAPRPRRRGLANVYTFAKREK